MIPSSAAFFGENFRIEEQPTRTYKINMQSDTVRGYTDEIEAMKQAIYKILLTERFRYVMYSENYGIELSDLFGQPVSYVCPELERRITEALTWDDRIESVDNFEFDISQKGTVHAYFTAHTVFGDVRAEREVNI